MSALASPFLFPFSPKKTGILPEIFKKNWEEFWQKMGKNGCFWPFLGYFWPIFTIFSQFPSFFVKNQFNLEKMQILL